MTDLHRPQGATAVMLTVDAVEKDSKLYPGMDSLDQREFWIWMGELEDILGLADPEKRQPGKQEEVTWPEAVRLVREMEQEASAAGHTVHTEDLGGFDA